jgi:hypothetical protein
MLSNNTSYHSTIATMPFELLFGEKALPPSFPNKYIQKIYYGETSSAERFNLLQKLCKWAHEFAMDNGLKTKMYHDKNTAGHKCKIWDKVLLSNDVYMGKNPTLAPHFKGPAEIIDIYDTNAKIKYCN